MSTQLLRKGFAGMSFFIICLFFYTEKEEKRLFFGIISKEIEVS